MPPTGNPRAAPLVALRGVGKTFPTGTRALARLELEVRAGEFLALLGPSGCGKSTALRIIAGLSEPTEGAVEWPAADAAPPAGNGSRIGFVFQEPTLMPWANVFNNVLLPLNLHNAPARQAAERVEAVLGRVGLLPFGRAYPRELSGGMRMRVSIARALVTEPELLLMDEPFAALDEITRFKLNDDLLQMWQALQTTVVFVTHSVFESVYLASRVVVMAARPGRVFSELAIDAPYPRDRISAPRPSTPLSAAKRRRRSHKPWRREPNREERDALFRCHRRAEQKAVPPAPPRARAGDRDGVLRIALPIIVLALGLAVWELVVRIKNIPPYVLPSPSLVLQTFAADWALLSRSLLVTLITTFEGFLLAAAGGVGLAVLFNQSRLVEYSLYPYAVILQVTPIVAVAPLLLIYLPQRAAVLACAWIVAFFPVLANTTLGLNSVDRNLADLFALYHASRAQVLWRLKLPSALPYILGGLRIAGGLSLIGAVVAEIAAGSAGAGSGLAYRIAESGYRLNIPRMFAALLLLSFAGIVIFYLLSLINHLALRRWHESALQGER